MRDVFIVSAVRTPVGSFNGALSRIPAVRLGSIVIDEAVKRSRVGAEEIDEVIIGNVLSTGLGQSPARQASIGAGLPATVRASSVNRGFASGMQAMIFASNAIASGTAEVAVAGGMENMSRAPYLLDKARFGYKYGGGELVDPIIKDFLWDPYDNCHTGEGAEAAAEKYGISREEQDRFALRSFTKAMEAQRKGHFDSEIHPMIIPVGRDRFASVNTDEKPQKFDQERLTKLPPVFRDNGTVTSGNSADVSDGASAFVMASVSAVKRLGLKPVAKLVSFSTSTDAARSSMATAGAIEGILKKNSLLTEDVDLFEINEDFSASVLAVMKELKLDEGRLNIGGGSIAIGSPGGAAGARIITTLLHAMERSGSKRGIAAIAEGGAEASAALFERTGNFF